MMKTKWVYKKPDIDKLAQLHKETGLSFPILNTLLNRGINNKYDISKFIKPSLDDIHEPSLMKDMDKAVARIKKAMREGETIVIYGDYD